MKTYSVIRKGFEHKVFCEDFLFTHETEDFFVGAVFDGCSTGKDSHFASALFGKAFKSVVENPLVLKSGWSDLSFINEVIFKESINKIFQIQNSLQLHSLEMLATVIVAVYNKKEDEIIITAVGDGVVAINDNVYVIDQNNTPDYLAYYLSEIVNYTKFTEWMKNHARQYRVKGVREFIISTDGVLSFKKIKQGNAEIKEPIDPVDYLLSDESLLKSSAMLGRKCNILELAHGTYHMDDLSIIKVLTEKEKNVELGTDIIAGVESKPSNFLHELKEKALELGYKIVSGENKTSDDTKTGDQGG